MQYPAAHQCVFSTHIIQFLDGGEQRYRDSEGPLHRWIIRLEMLDASELASVEEFFASQQGQYASFGFTDPRNGVDYPDCSLAEDQLALQLEEEMRGSTSVVIRENRS
jgi:hypothetical protein